jgi:heat shock protein HtpX
MALVGSLLFAFYAVAIVAQRAALLTGDNDLADFFLAIVVGRITRLLVMTFVFAISRYREYVADGDAVRIAAVRQPDVLRSV